MHLINYFCVLMYCSWPI